MPDSLKAMIFRDPGDFFDESESESDNEENEEADGSLTAAQIAFLNETILEPLEDVLPDDYLGEVMNE